MVFIANLFQRSVAFFDRLRGCHLLESDLALFLKVLVADFLLGWLKLGDVCVVTFLHLFVGALKDGVLLERLDSGLFEDAAHAVFLGLASGKVDASWRESHFVRGGGGPNGVVVISG